MSQSNEGRPGKKDLSHLVGRPLVPFFLPGSELENTALAPASDIDFSLAPGAALPVREWSNDGFFQPAKHITAAAPAAQQHHMKRAHSTGPITNANGVAQQQQHRSKSMGASAYWGESALPSSSSQQHRGSSLPNSPARGVGGGGKKGGKAGKHPQHGKAAAAAVAPQQQQQQRSSSANVRQRQPATSETKFSAFFAAPSPHKVPLPSFVTMGTNGSSASTAAPAAPAASSTPLPLPPHPPSQSPPLPLPPFHFPSPPQRPINAASSWQQQQQHALPPLSPLLPSYTANANVNASVISPARPPSLSLGGSSVASTSAAAPQQQQQQRTEEGRFEVLAPEGVGAKLLFLRPVPSSASSSSSLTSASPSALAGLVLDYAQGPSSSYPAAAPQQQQHAPLSAPPAAAATGAGTDENARLTEELKRLLAIGRQ